MYKIKEQIKVKKIGIVGFTESIWMQWWRKGLLLAT